MFPRRTHGLLLALLAPVAFACSSDVDPEASDPDPVESPAPSAPDREPAPELDTDSSEPSDASPPDDRDAAASADQEANDGPDLSVELSLTDVVGMDSPTAGAVGPDGTLYLAERAGTVHPLEAADGDEGLGDPVVDISSETTTDGERGLLGLAFAGDGSELFVSSTDAAGDTIVIGVPLDADGTLRPEDRRIVFTLDQPFGNHNGGHVVVGPDGMLYLGLGDGGGGGDPLGAGQDLATPLGALLRIDPTSDDAYAIPADNPFADEEGASAEIYAFGLRNPWRFSFDEPSERLWIADVGQSDREEINAIAIDEAAGANFGWNLMEGTRAFAGGEPEDHVAPVHEYDHSDGRCSITGGLVYRGTAIPQLQGVYLFTDLCDSTLRGLILDDEGRLVEEGPLGVAGDQVVSFAQDADGEVYVLDFGGAVRRLEPA